MCGKMILSPRCKKVLDVCKEANGACLKINMDLQSPSPLPLNMHEKSTVISAIFPT